MYGRTLAEQYHWICASVAILCMNCHKLQLLCEACIWFLSEGIFTGGFHSLLWQGAHHVPYKSEFRTGLAI